MNFQRLRQELACEQFPQLVSTLSCVSRRISSSVSSAAAPKLLFPAPVLAALPVPRVKTEPCPVPRRASWKPVMCLSRKGQKLSSAPSTSLRGCADYCPLLGGREGLSKGRREGKKAELGCHSSNNNRPSWASNWWFTNLAGTASALKRACSPLFSSFSPPGFHKLPPVWADTDRAPSAAILLQDVICS